MSSLNRLASSLEGVDIQAQAAAFYSNAPPLDVLHAALLPADGRIRQPRLRKDAHIIPSSFRRSRQ